MVKDTLESVRLQKYSSEQLKNYLVFNRNKTVAPEYLEKINLYDWSTIVKSRNDLHAFCPWHLFSRRNWENVVRDSSCLRFFKLEYCDYSEHIADRWMFRGILESCYFNKFRNRRLEGIWKTGITDAAAFLILKRMDRKNSENFLRHMYNHDYWKFKVKYPQTELDSPNWDFLEELGKISPEEALDIEDNEFLPFHITLTAPDRVFEKLFPLFDLDALDPAGNTLLLPAFIFCMCTESSGRYRMLLKKGLDPDRKNLAGFSCSNVIRYFQGMPYRSEYEVLNLPHENNQ